MKKIIDISWPISESMTGYKNRPTFSSTIVKNFTEHQARQTTISLDAHAGTHVDAPAHFLEDGVSIEHIPLDRLMGNCMVLDCTMVESAITQEHLKSQLITESTIILLKTRNSNLSPITDFNPEFVYLDQSGARYLMEKKVKAVGIDYLGIERAQPDHATHTLLLHAGIPIIEGLRLEHVIADSYFFIALPLNLIGNEAAPARAILLHE